MSNEFPDWLQDDAASAAAAFAEPYGDDSADYLLNDIGLALRVHDEWH